MKKKQMIAGIIILCMIITSEHGYNKDDEEIKDTKLIKTLILYLEKYSKAQQANIGAFIISSASVPIFVLILLFKIDNMKILDVMSAFAAGALIGDVFIHNIPEIYQNNQNSHDQHHGHYHKKASYWSKILKLITTKEIFICWGVLFLFIMEKLLGYFSEKIVAINRNCIKKKDDEDEEHNHHHHSHNLVLNSTNIIMSLFGDFLHNVTDGLGIGAGFNKSLKLGLSLSLSIFFHEIPHEIGDFSYLLKQKMSLTNAFLSQFLSALGAFLGVYLSNLFGHEYSNHIISFASGAFLYLGINTIMGDLKRSHSLFNICLQCLAFMIGVLVLMILL